VAVLDCITLVTPRPASMAFGRELKLRDSTPRRFSPNTRSTSVRTMCVPHTSRAIAASRLSRWIMGAGFGPPGAGMAARAAASLALRAR
jgi:hypothetical protein